MLATTSYQQIDSLFNWLVMLARRHDVVAIVKVEDLFKIVYSARVSLEVFADLKDLNIYHLIVYGKTTKTKLTAEQRDQLLIYIRECNTQLN